MKKPNHVLKRTKKSIIKSGVVIMLSAVMLFSQTAVVSYADGGNGNNKGKDNIKIEQKQNEQKKVDKVKAKEVDKATKAELREKLQIMVSFGDGNWVGLPEGMFKKGFLPYGLAKRYAKGDFPYGLAKRIKDFNYDGHHQTQSIESLKTLIVSAKYKLSVENTKVYSDSVAAKAKLQLAVTAAEAYVAAYDDTKSATLKAECDKLKAAIFELDNSEIAATAQMASLNTLLVELTTYKTDYYAKLTPAKKIALDNLIILVQSYVVVPSTKVLTIGIYNDIMNQAKVFEDHMDRLSDLVTEAQAILYKDPAAAVKEYKNVEGTTVGLYLVNSNKTLEAAINTTTTFINTYSTQSANVIESKYIALNAAITVFKNNIILGDVEINAITLVQTELDAYYLANVTTTNQLLPLKALIDDLKIYTTKAQPLTQAKFNSLLDASNIYLKDLYVAIKADLLGHINAANALLIDTTKTYNEPARPALVAAVLAAQTYYNGTTHLYAVLKNHITLLDAAMLNFITIPVPVVVTP